MSNKKKSAKIETKAEIKSEPVSTEPELTPMVQFINGRRVVRMVPKNYGRERSDVVHNWEPSYRNYY